MHGRILLVDEDPCVRSWHSMFLEEEGFATTTAENAKQALEHLEELEFDVIVTALGGRAKGLFLCRHIRERWPRLPVVILTGSPDPDMRRKAFDAGAFDYVIKATELADQKHLALKMKQAISWSAQQL